MGRAAYSRQKDALTQESFDLLLAQLHPNREQAGAEYANLRAKLRRFFILRSDPTPGEAADETLDRVARKNAARAVTDSLEAYAYCVARMIFLERNKREQRTQTALAQYVASRPHTTEPEEPAYHLPTDAFFNALSQAERGLLQEYYAETAQAPQRAQLAGKLGLSLNQLRLHIFRLRTRLHGWARPGPGCK